MNSNVLFLGNDHSDWQNLFATNSVDELSLSINDSPKAIVDFAKKYNGKLITGFISYEYGVHQLGVPTKEFPGIPAAYFCAFDSFNTQIKLDSQPREPWENFRPIISKNEYEANFNKIINHIISGDCYQLNYTHQLFSKTQATPKQLFSSLRQNNTVGYSAFIESKDWAIHSLSPEQFIKIESGIITTKPIKGTISRGLSSQEDENNLNTLLQSEKEQAELYMIIDLLRNDLGKVCEAGSVEVLKSKSVQSLEKVFHTYGHIQGTLKNNIHPIEALLSMLPGGSISGCPKKRACELIYELESKPRGVYTGTIGYILPNGTLNFNIAIRTILQQFDQLTLGVGGGITLDSIQQDEFEETLIKAASLQP